MAALLIDVYSRCREVKMFVRIISNAIVLLIGRARSILCPETNFPGHWDKALYAPLNRNCPGKPVSNGIPVYEL
jgi:hypothetical protein